MRRWLLALVLTAAGVPLASAHDALAAIDACIGQLDPALDVGFARVAERCPDLAAALAGSPQAAWLPADWNKPGNELSASGLAELRILLARQPPPAARELRVARVGAVLRQLGAADHRHPGWWARFKEWLREVLARAPPESDSGWLRRMIGNVSVPQAVLEGVVWAALGATVALAAAIVLSELRAAGLLGLPRRRGASTAVRHAAARAAATLGQVEAAAPAEQPRLLLELIVARLREQDRLPPARALTVHELTRAAHLPQRGELERLTVLAAACERVRFAAAEIAPAALQAAIVRGRELLAALDAAGT